MPNEFIIQRQLRVKYNWCMTISGGRLMEVGDIEKTRADHLESAIGLTVAGIHYQASEDWTHGALSLEEVIRIRYSHGIPVSGCRW